MMIESKAPQYGGVDGRALIFGRFGLRQRSPNVNKIFPT